MHKYLIELMKYTETGVPTNEYTYDSADTPQGLADKVSKWNKMRYTTVDDEGKTIVGNKMYKVTPKQGVYRDIAEKANLDDAAWKNFLDINGVIYH